MFASKPAASNDDRYRSMCRQCGEIVEHRLRARRSVKCPNGHEIASELNLKHLSGSRRARWSGRFGAYPKQAPASLSADFLQRQQPPTLNTQNESSADGKPKALPPLEIQPTGLGVAFQVVPEPNPNHAPGAAIGQSADDVGAVEDSHLDRKIDAMLLKATLFEDARVAYQRGDYATSMRLWRTLGDQGHAGAQCCLGGLYEKGQGVPQDHAAALSWYRKAADRGHAAAQGHLGFFYSKGRGRLPKDDREAARLYKLAADQGNATAQTNLGVFYEQGRGGLPKDDREAARFYRRAAEQGSAFGQVKLGFFYFEGRGGLPKDAGQATRLFKLAADQGEAAAQAALDFMYTNGHDVPHDDPAPD
jgi:hypothetical protein